MTVGGVLSIVEELSRILRVGFRDGPTRKKLLGLLEGEPGALDVGRVVGFERPPQLEG